MTTRNNYLRHRLDETGDTLGNVPFGQLIGGVLEACVEAQADASDTALKYTKEVLFENDPSETEVTTVTFSFKEDGVNKKITVPLITIVPVPYLKLDNVNLDFDAKVSVNNRDRRTLNATIPSETVEEVSFDTATAQTNLHININAHTSDIPAGMANLLKLIGEGGIIIEDADNVEQEDSWMKNWIHLPDGEEELAHLLIDKQRSAHGSGYRSLADVIASIRYNTIQLAKDWHPSDDDDIARTLFTGIHVNWTLPFRFRNPDRSYFVEDYELLTTALSALLWRKYNGPMRLYTDSYGYEYYNRLQLLDLWDYGIDTETLDSIPMRNINPEIFWAAAKLFAIRNEQAPFILMDTDLIVWHSIVDQLKDIPLAAFHRESLASTDCYIPFRLLKKRADYQPDPDWNWSEDPFNTALTYFGDIPFAQYYAKSAIDFMRDNHERPMEMVSQMVFAEQRIFAMCAQARGIGVTPFLSSSDEERGFTHLWGAKTEAKANPAARYALCHDLGLVLRGCFPEFGNLPVFQQIFRKYNIL